MQCARLRPSGRLLAPNSKDQFLKRTSTNRPSDANMPTAGERNARGRLRSAARVNGHAEPPPGNRALGKFRQPLRAASPTSKGVVDVVLRCHRKKIDDLGIDRGQGRRWYFIII
jgi:hypothetical protein